MIISSPKPLNDPKSIPGTFVTDESTIQTPPSVAALKPGLEEMHPSRVHKSTTKGPDLGLLLGFTDVNARLESPTKNVGQTIPPQTPTKTQDTLPSHMSSPSFDFKLNRPEKDLSAAAQKIMESVREEAAEVKIQMQKERDEQMKIDAEVGQTFGFSERKIAKPKGKAGRYSDVHMQEFKKMDPITDHVSLWKNAKSALRSPVVSLKRSKSQAGFDEEKLVSRSAIAGECQQPRSDDDRSEINALGKRVKQHHHNDVSSTRPDSRGTHSTTKSSAGTPNLGKPKLPAYMTTPTKASLARASSTKSATPFQISSLNLSKSTKSAGDQLAAKGAVNGKHLTSLPRLQSMKSILHKPQPKYSDDPIKIAAGTHVLPTKSSTSVNKDLLYLPGTPSKGLIRPPSKHVQFTPTSQMKPETAISSPSPSKIPAPHFQFKKTEKSNAANDVVYPTLLRPGPLNSNPTKPGDFTFRSAKNIQVGPATTGLTLPTIRQVRQSGVPTRLSPVAFQSLPGVPHGLPNKKRRRSNSDLENVENEAPDEEHDLNEAPRAKKIKGMTAAQQKKTDSMSMAEKRRLAGKGAQSTKAGNNVKEKGKRFLSLSRLNMLARPKERR